VSLVEIIVAIVILGLVIWAVDTFLPLDPRFKTLIYVVAVIFVIVWILQGMGWIGSMRGGANTIAIH